MFNYKWNLKDLEKVESNGLTVFSCFAGGGGSSQGYKMAGYDVIGCNEIDPRQMEIYKHNLNPKFSYLEDIRTFRTRDDLPGELFELDILDASFPCSLFSTANSVADEKKGKEVKFREGQSKQVLDDLAFETISLVDKIKPKVCVFENVKGLLEEKNKWYVQQIYAQFKNIGYKICHHLVNCADLGVPQRRQRVFFFAVRDDIEVETRDLFAEEPHLDLNIKEKHIKLKEFISVRLKTETQTYSEIRFGDIMCDKNKCCKTLTPGVRYWVNELELLDESCIKKIGTWSDDYKFLDQDVKYVLGMSVPPLAMYRISKEIEKQWLLK